MRTTPRRRCHPVLIVTPLCLVLLLSWPAFSQHQHDSQRPRSDHSFADVERFTALFEAEERDAWQKPDAVVAALGVRPGMTVADVGAGTGYFSRRFAAAVGPAGAVFASDLEPNMVVALRTDAERHRLANLIPVLASADDPRLPDGRADLIFFCNTWHHIAGRVAYADRLRRDLAPAGRVAVVDFLPGELPIGPRPEHKMSAEEIIAEFQQAGYRLAARLDDLLPYQYVLIFSAETAD